MMWTQPPLPLPRVLWRGDLRGLDGGGEWRRGGGIVCIYTFRLRHAWLVGPLAGPVLASDGDACNVIDSHIECMLTKPNGSCKIAYPCAFIMRMSLE